MDMKVDLTAERVSEMVARGIWPERVLLEDLDREARRAPDAPAIIEYRSPHNLRTELSYRELAAHVGAIARNLAVRGVVRGDVVSYVLPNWWQAIALHLACLKVGAISNPLMPIFRERELRFMLAFAESKLLIIPKSFRDFDYVQMIDNIRADLPDLEAVLVVGAEGNDSFEALLIEPAARAPATTPARPNDVIEILYTSGTTGQPKGVMHTSNTLMSSLAAFIERMALSSGDVVLMASPLAHQTGFAYGMMLSIRLGCPLVLMDVWNGERAAEIIAAEGVTFTMASTPFLADLTKVAERNPAATKSLRVFVTAGAPIPSVLVTRARGLLGAQIVSAWGMTENGTVTSTCLQDSTEKAAETDGCPLPGMEVRVVDADGRVLAAGEEGRLQARTPTCFVGYLKRPELNGVDPDGWFETGDIARLAADGYIRITGRAKDVIIRGGENIPVVEIENLLYKHPAIVDVAIVAMPDPRLGERACAFVVARPGSDVSLPALVAFLEEFQVARQYMPERVELMDDLPRTASGKIQKVALREVAQALVVNATPAE